MPLERNTYQHHHKEIHKMSKLIKAGCDTNIKTNVSQPLWELSHFSNHIVLHCQCLMSFVTAEKKGKIVCPNHRSWTYQNRIALQSWLWYEYIKHFTATLRGDPIGISCPYFSLSLPLSLLYLQYLYILMVQIEVNQWLCW